MDSNLSTPHLRIGLSQPDQGQQGTGFLNHRTFEGRPRRLFTYLSLGAPVPTSPCPPLVFEYGIQMHTVHVTQVRQRLRMEEEGTDHAAL